MHVVSNIIMISVEHSIILLGFVEFIEDITVFDIFSFKNKGYIKSKHMI